MMYSDSSALRARVKLLKRQMQELNALRQNQKQVRKLIKEQTQVGFCSIDILTRIAQITQGAKRLALLSDRQSYERKQLRTRHLEEELNLKFTIDAVRSELK